MTEYNDVELKKSIQMYAELYFKHRCFIRIGGRSVNNPNGIETTEDFFKEFIRFCSYVIPRSLTHLYQDKIKEFGNDLQFAFNSTKSLEEWFDKSQKLEEILEKTNVALCVC